MRHPLLALAASLLTAAAAPAAPKYAIVVGPHAPKLEQTAAADLAEWLKQLYGVEAAVSATVPGGADHLFLVGSPATNPAVAKAAAGRWPKLTDQGHILRSANLGGRKVLLVGGGSPVATVWAVAELAHRFGVRTFLHGDVLPEKPAELMLDGIDVTLEPAVRVRAWQVLDDDPAGFAGWGLADQKLLLRQLAKLKFNRVVIGVSADVPLTMFDRPRFPAAGDTPGRKAFKGVKEFENPDLAGKTTDADRRAATAALIRGITDAAGEFGLTVGAASPSVQSLALRGFLPRVPATLPDITGDGFSVTAEVPGDLNPAVYHLARRSFDPKLTAKAAHTQFLTPFTGAASAERVLVGFSRIDEAITLIDKNDPKFAALTPDVIVQQLKSGEAPPAWWKDAGKLYAGGMDEMYRGIRATYHEPARPVLLYYAKRCEFAVHYFAAVEAARLAGQAKAKGDKEAVVGHLEKATEAVYNALNAYGDVARDPSDRGAIAALAEFAYRPLKAELKLADKAARQK